MSRKLKQISCGFVAEHVTEYIDEMLEASESLAVGRHAAECAVCRARIQEHRRAAASLKALGRVWAPAKVSTQLRVNASRERSRQLRWSSAPAFFRWMREEASLRLDNVMKPFAIPVAGGLTAASLVFSMIVSSYPVGGRTLDGVGDVPMSINTAAVFKGIVPFDFTRRDVIVDLVIDPQGRILDYRIVGGDAAGDPEVRRSLENILLFTEFQPATSFGQRVAGRVRISFQTGRLDVRG
jgi:hypothetical protein